MKALQGVRILDFSWAMAGPYATLLLGFLGAEVIRVENRKRVCLVRKLGRTLGWKDEPDVDRSVEFNLINLNKLGITLDLEHPRAVKLCKRLVALSDVVLDNFRPGAMERLGLGYDTLCQVKPDIIMVSISAAGDSGPEKQALGFASIFHAVSGLAYQTGYPDSPPGYIRGSSDTNVGVTATLAILAALIQKQKSGKGAHVDVSAREAISCLFGHIFTETAMMGRDPGRRGNEEPGMAPHNCYRCREEDRWISIAVGTDKEWQALVRIMGSPEWAGDVRFATVSSRWQHRQELDTRIEEWTQNYEPLELTHLLQGAGVAAFPSLSPIDIFCDPHLKQRGWVVEVEHPRLGRQVVMVPPWKFSATPPQVEAPAPLMGQHNNYIFKELLGLSDLEVAELEQEGVLS